ncbi:MAG: hypothetical protein Q9161_002502 [Pseudevernia consocians]
MAITRSQPSKQQAGTPVTPKKQSSQVPLNGVRDRPGAAISKQLRASHSAKKRARSPSDQLREELESAVAGIASSKGHEEALKFLFVPYPDVKDIAEETHIAIDASNTSDRFLARYPMYSSENMSMIEQELGKGFASHGMTSTKPYYEIPILHQGVVTMQHLSHSFNRDVTFRSWEWLQAQLKMVTARPKDSSTAKVHRSSTRKTPTHPRKAQQHALFSNPTNPCVIFLHWTIEPGPSTADISAIYATITTLQSSRPEQLFRAFPSQSEITCETSKLPDIRTLDAIASTSPPKYAYRPLTCFTHGERKHNPANCPLHKHSQIIMKRTHSCGGEHVELIDGDAALPRHHPASPTPSPPPHWFGQSYEPFFSVFGEFRVFIVARPCRDDDPGALRGRNGRILHTYDRLRSRDDWGERYESLEVGVRLDVGVGKRAGEGGEKRFFVNEITRFYGADYFSQHTLGAPQQEVCWAFAEAVDGYFGGGEGGG